MDFIHKYPYSNMHELNLDWLIDETKKLVSQMATVQEILAQIEIMTEDEIKAMIDTAISTNNIQIYNAINDLHTLITSEYTRSIQSAVDQLRIYIDNQDVYYNGLAQGYANQAKIDANAYTDEKVLNYTMMINPITGQYEDVRDVVSDVVMYFHTENSLTAGEYDALDITAGYYDSKDLTAYDYDFNGKLRLP